MDKSLKLWLLSQAAYYLEYLHSDRAIVLLEALKIIDNKNRHVDKVLSYAYLQEGRFDEAIESADHFLKITPLNAEVKTMMWIKKCALAKKIT